MSKPRFNYTHFAMSNDDNSRWRVFENLDKRIPKTFDGYGDAVGEGITLEEAIASAMENGVKKFTIKVIKDD